VNNYEDNPYRREAVNKQHYVKHRLKQTLNIKKIAVPIKRQKNN